MYSGWKLLVQKILIRNWDLNSIWKLLDPVQGLGYLLNNQIKQLLNLSLTIADVFHYITTIQASGTFECPYNTQARYKPP